MPNKIRFALALLLVLLFSGVGFATINPSKPQKGDGTIDNPYEITSAAELYWLASTVNDGKCASTVKNGNCSAKLMEDITVNKYVLTDEIGASKVGADGTYKGTAPENVWTPIGNRSRQYTGVFDGDGHTISGVYFNNAYKDTVGLFGVLNDGFGVLSAGSVKGVGVTDSYIRGKDCVGGIVGVNKSSNNAVTDVYNAGLVSGNHYVGGILGCNSGSVGNVYNTGNVSGYAYVGGIVGENQGRKQGSLYNAYSIGAVSGKKNVGGVAGSNESGASISNSYYNVEFFSGSAVGVKGHSSTNEVYGMSSVDFAFLDIEKAFPESDAWVRYEGEQPVLENGKLVYKLPGLKAFKDVYPEYVLLQPENGVYEIGTADQLKGFARIVNSGNIKINAKLTADIVLNTDVFKEGTLNVADTSKFTKWTVIKSFEGNFNGDGHTISGVYFNDDKKDSVGLFGKIGNGIGNVGFVENVGIVDSYIKGKDYVGSVTAVNLGSVSNVYNTGAMDGNQNVGGLVGYNKGSVSNVYNTGNVGGNQNVGGMVGYNKGSVSNGYSSALVSGTSAIGGVAGVNDKGSINNGYYNIELFNGSSVGKILNSGSLTNVSGKTALELASLDVSEAFSGSEAWTRYEGEQPILKNGKLIYKLPGLKVFKNFYPEADAFYEIGSAEQLKEFARLVNNGEIKINARLTADIVLNKNVLDGDFLNGDGSNFSQWTPIGTEKNPYQGIFNGNGHTISGIYINNDKMSYVGLFGIIENKGVVANVGIVDSYIAGGLFVGGIVGFNKGSVTRAFNMAMVMGGAYFGGIAGKSEGFISDVYNMNSVSGIGDHVGGIVGENAGSVRNVYSAGSVKGGNWDVGSVIGNNAGEGTVHNAYYVSDMACYNCKDKGLARGLSREQLASLDISSAFPESEAWIAYTVEHPVLSDDGKTVYKRPGLKVFEESYPKLVAEYVVYEIGAVEGLVWFAQLVNSGYTKVNAKLTANIELNRNVLENKELNGDGSSFTQWIPIGTEENPFEGSFDGDGYTISGLYFDNDRMDNVGFFGKIGESGVVKNVGVTDSYIKGYNYVGGVVGYNDGGYVGDVYSTSSVNGNQKVGGVVGYSGGTVIDVFNTGIVRGKGDFVGGVVGYTKGTVGNTYNLGPVSGSSSIGGVVGANDGGSVSNCYYSTDNFNGKAIGISQNSGVETNVSGLTSREFVDLEIDKAFPNSSAWNHFEEGQFVSMDNEKMVFKLFALKALGFYPEVDVYDPQVYEIGSVEQLKEFARRVNNGETKINGKLTKSIVLNKNVLDGDFLNGDGSNFTSWTPIGTEKNPYQGVFNGNGRTISGIYVNNSDMKYVGLFGVIENKGVVANVGIVDSYIAGGLFVGGIVGFNKGSVTRAFNMAMVMGGSYFGGIAGISEGFISDVYNMNSVSGIGDHVGGIVGGNAGSVRNVYSVGSVKGGNWDVGSVIGNNAGEGTVHNAYYVSDMACYNCKDNGLARGLSREQLASLDISSAFPKSDAWMVYSGKQPVLSDDGETVYKLPGLKVLNTYPEINAESYGGVIEIKTAAQLKGLAQRVNNGDTKIDVVLGADICLNACEEGEKPLLEQIANGKRDFVQWTPIGLIGKPYVGNFDGRGHTIRGLYIDNEKMDQVGLFGVIGVSGTAAGVSASVKNVGLIDSYVKGADVVGGVVGLNDKASISDVYNAGTVYGALRVGGVVGRNNSGSATNVYNLGEVKGDLYVGGVVGESNGSVSRVYNDALVSGAQYVGGVVGYNSGKVSDAYNMGSVSSEGYRVGGVVGYNMAFVDNVYSSADVKAPGYDGGAVGYSQGGSINNVYYNTDMICEHCGGSVGFVEGDAFVTNASGMTTAQLAALNVAEAFKGSEAWVNAPKDNPTMNNGKLIYKLPGLKAFSGLYPDVEFTVYQISNADELKQFALRVNNGENKIHGELTRNIELNSGVLKDGSLNVTGTSKFTKWTPIGTNANPYAGVFDGKGFTISGLYFNDATRDTVGLFGKIANSGTVKNVGLIDSYINGKNNIGGIAGYEDGCFFSNVYNVGIVVGINAVGGIAGFSRGSLSEVYNMGSVKGDAYVGGVVGYKEYGSVAKNYNMGAVSGYYEVGGLIGRNANASVSNSYNKGKVSVVKADGYVVGGIVGRNLLGALVNDVYNMGEVCANLDVGGIVGAFEDGSMSNAYSSADVSGNGFVGGTVGYSKNGSISNVYYNTDMICKNCGGSVGVVEGNASVTNVSGISTAQLAALDVASAFANAEGIWKSGSVVNGENGTVIYKLPYLSKFEESNQPSITGSLEVSVANNDVYLKSDAVTNEDFKVSLVVNGRRSADKDGEFKFTKSTWGEDGVVKGAYDGVNFTLMAPSVVISSDKKKAKVFGYSENTVEITENVNVPKIDFTRKLYKGKFSTVMFPFTPNEAIKNSGFYRFKDVSKNAEGKWQVHLDKAKEVLANTPYIMVVGDNGDGKEYVESISLNEGGVISATPLKEYAVSGCLEEHLPDCVESGWKFIGSYEYTKWTDDNERASEIGKTYAFAGANGLSQGMKIGQFAKVGSGAYLYPMRAYLQYTGGAKAARAVPGSARESAVFAELPENIDVVVDGESDSDEETTVIGSLNTRTGEITPVKNSYFDVKGRNLGNKKPNVKGSFYRQ